MGYLEMWSRQESDPEKTSDDSAQSSGKYMLNMLSNLLEFHDWSKTPEHSTLVASI